MPGQRSKIRWVIWFLAVSFYFYEYLLRISPSVMVNELATTFKIDAAEVGTLSAFYFWAYAPMQLPAGMLMDRYGTRRLLTLATIICALGSIFVGISTDLWLAQLGRLFTGLGSAFAFVGLVYICSHWFEVGMLALLIGLGNSLGMLGGVAEGPLSWLVEIIGWRATSVSLGIAGFALAIVMYLLIKGTPIHQRSSHDLKKLWENLKIVSRNPQTWVNASIALLFLATTNSFAGLWAVPFLTKAYPISKVTAGWVVSTFFLGWIVGGPIIGHLSDRLSHRKTVLIICSAIAAGLLSLFIYIPLPIWALFVVAFILGIFCSCQLLTYSVAVELNPRIAKGTAVALTNFWVFLFSALVQPFVGLLLDLSSGQKILTLTAEDYHIALAVFPITLGLAFIISFFLREKRHPSHG